MKSNTNITIDEDIKNKAKVKAKQVGLSLSAYITTLITKDLKGSIEVETDIEENSMDNDKNFMNADMSDSIDEICEL